MAAITFPLLMVVDDSGAIVSGATVTIASVTDKSGSPITSHGATVNQAGPNVSVDYDPEAKGEAWVTLAISKAGSTITNLNASPSFFLAMDSGRVITNLDAKVSSISANPAPQVDLGIGSGMVSASPAPATDSFAAMGAGLVAQAGYYNGKSLEFRSGPVAGSAPATGRVRRQVRSHVVGAGLVHTFQFSYGSRFPVAPAAGDIFLIVD